jgi:hypothetical protein
MCSQQVRQHVTTLTDAAIPFKTRGGAVGILD